MAKDLLNWDMDRLHPFAEENRIGDTAILDWLNYNQPRHVQFWYGPRTIREAVLMAMANGIGGKQ